VPSCARNLDEVTRVTSANGKFLANVAQASRKDLRDAVAAARGAHAKWWGATAYNRGQVMYRWAEMAESRRAELVEHVGLAEGLRKKDAQLRVGRAIDRIVWYAGWTDKVTQVLGGANPVAGPFFNFSLPVPSGVIGVVAPQESSLEGFVEAVAAPMCVGNSVVALASELRPTPAVILAEMTATSDFPGGVLNVLTGFTGELVAHLATHEDVDGIDVTGSDDLADELSRLAAGSIKRVYRERANDDENPLRRLRTFVETSTVWHTIGQ
jgi:acyl-CoA reductase-like NAD-dependent aldehyde dehydrogenase